MTERILIVGSGAREHAIAAALARSPQKPELIAYGPARNPAVARLTNAYGTGSITNLSEVLAFVATEKPTLAVIGPEAPLAAGLADALLGAGVPVVGPTKKLAQLEASKSFTRELLRKHGIEGNPFYQRFDSPHGVAETLQRFAGRHVIKDDGLAGGKGVKVWGDHLQSMEESLAYCKELTDAGHAFVIEEKLEGEEFSLLSFCDGETLRHMPAVQDHKRAYDGDKGPNTGGMGSYTDQDGKLPFLSSEDIAAGQRMNEQVARALRKECEAPYRGVLYGGFMATRNGVRLIEYNARFGDPESLNLLTLLESDFVTVCRGIAEGTLHTVAVSFANKASVCKYVVSEGYPDATSQGVPMSLPERMPAGSTVYLGGVVEGRSEWLASGRAAGFVSVADTLAEAESACEQLASAVPGRFFHRKDIGTEALLQRRVEHMKQVRTA